MRLLRTTIAGGALFLAPFVILLIVLGKAFELTRALIGPLAEWLPFESLVGLEAPKIAAGLLLVLVCFVAGLLARTYTDPFVYSGKLGRVIFTVSDENTVPPRKLPAMYH